MAITNKLPDGSTWNSFVLQNVTEDQTVTVTFAPDLNDDGIPDKYQTVTVLTSTDGDGTVSPQKNEVALGGNAVFTVTPGAGQALYQIKNGESVLYTNNDPQDVFDGTYTYSNVMVGTTLTFVFGVDTDGDGIPDMAETWYTISMEHDANTAISSTGVPGTDANSIRIKAGNSAVFNFSANSGYAIRTLTIDGTQYINDGRPKEPEVSWSSYTFTNVNADHAISVTGGVTTGSTPEDLTVPDEYKLSVTPVMVDAAEEGSVTLPPILVIYGHDATIAIEAVADKAVDTIVVGDTTYINDPDYGKAAVTDSESLAEAIDNPEISELSIDSPVLLSGESQINRPITLDGNGETITQSSVGKTFTFTQNSTVNDVVIESTADNTEWHSSYGIQFYTGEHTLNNATLTGGNAGVIVNSATLNLEGTIDVSGNTFGGIEVCKSASDSTARSAMPAGVLNINNATIINSTEEYGKPTIWIDGNTDAEGIVNGADAFTVVEVPHGGTTQKQFYLDAANVKPIRVGDSCYDTLPEAISAVPDGVSTTIELHADVLVTSDAIQIPSGKIIVLDLKGHRIYSNSLPKRVITNAGDLTITGDGIITAEESGASGTGAINNDGTLKILSGTFKGGAGANGAAINNRTGGVLTIEGGTVEGCPRGIQNLGTLTIVDGMFTGTDSYTGSKEGNAVINGPSGIATIKGGTFVGDLNGVSNMDNGNGTLTIDGGKFYSNGSEGSGAIYNGDGNTIYITDCFASVAGESGATFANRGTAVVTGGTFVGDNCNSQTYTINSGQTDSAGCSILLGPDVSVTGTFGALRVVSGTATVEGGTYQVSECDEHASTPFYALYCAGECGEASVDVQDGTFVSLNSAVLCGCPGITNPSHVTIQNGTFTSPESTDVLITRDVGTITLSGGNYSSNIVDYVDDLHEVSEVEGRYQVVAKS